MKTAADRSISIIRRSTIALAFTLLTQLAYADPEYVASWGPEVGATAPMLAALDQDGNQQNLSSLSGSNGLLFVFNRSVDW
tara:strand:- start:207 stop:449 length:243 start_codon:yes stop_codon:yes gene_type:complete